MSTIKNWSTTAGNNNDPSPDGFPENMAPSGVNDSAREVMASVRAQWNQAEWFDYGDPPSRVSGAVFSLTGTHTATYAVGRRIRVKGTAGTLYGTISDQTLTGGATQVTVALDSGSLTATLTAVELGILAPTSDSLPATYRAGDGAVGTPSLTFRDDTDNGFYRIGADNVGMAVAGALAMEFDPIGAVQMPLQPCVTAHNSPGDTNVTGNNTEATVDFDAELFDQNSDFAADTFTAPVSGRYLLIANVSLLQINGASVINLRIQTSNRIYSHRLDIGGNSTASQGFNSIASVIADMDAADTVFISITVNGLGVDTADVHGTTAPATWFSACLLA